jgi:thiol-disulfide isomerase/thioredoxin
MSSQNSVVKVKLRDSLDHNKKISFTSQDTVKMAWFPYKNDSLLLPIYRLKLENFLWNSKTFKNNFHNIEYAYSTKSDSSLFFVKLFPEENFIRHFIFENKTNRKFDLRFKSSLSNDTSSITIPVRIEPTVNEKLMFYPLQLLIGKIQENGLNFLFQIWSFQTGPYIQLIDSESSKLHKEKYIIGEELIVNDHVIISFEKFNYVNRMIEIKKSPFSTNSILYGYKQNRTVKDWNTEHSLFKKEGIDNQKPLMIYYTGSWCAPCKRELPKMKRIANVCIKNDIQVLSIARVHNETDEEALDYLRRNKYPGFHALASKNNNYELAEFLKAETYPTYIFVDSDGKIIYRADKFEERGKQLDNFFGTYIKSLQ